MLTSACVWDVCAFGLCGGVLFRAWRFANFSNELSSSFSLHSILGTLIPRVLIFDPFR